MTNLVEVIIPAPERDFEVEARQVLAQARAYAIDSAEMYTAAAEDLQAVKARYKAIDEQRRRITVPLDQAKRAAMDFFRPALEFLEQAETTLKRAMVAYDQEQTRKRREVEAAAREAARKEQERLEKLAAAAEAKGKEERAEELRDRAALLPAAVVMPPAPPAPQGISFRTRWEFRIVDVSALPREYLIADEKKIGGVVRALKGETRIAGVEVYEVQDIAARSQ